MTLISKTSSFAERGLDPYFTPWQAIHALLGLEKIPKRVFDPCCGNGAILDVLEAAGRHVSGADVHDYGWRGTIVKDFLANKSDLRGTAIVSNPPYRFAEKFIQKVIDEGSPYHVWLLRLNFLESMRRKPFFESYPPSRIHVSSRRLPQMHRHGWVGTETSSNACYCWMVWQKGAPRSPFNLFDWRDYAPPLPPLGAV
jgi:hypothetical protein